MGTAITLKFYTEPPGHNPLGREISCPVRPLQFIGPVHQFSHSDFFVTVEVPLPNNLNCLAWMNIWSCVRGPGVNYAYIVSQGVLADWLRGGFQAIFLA